MTTYSNYRRALSAIVKIIAPHSTPDGRRSMASKLAASGNGEVIENLALSYGNIGLLFNPGDPAAAAALAEAIKNARESGEIQSIIPPEQKGILATDLLAWPCCPPVIAANPLSYWLPLSDGSTASSGATKDRKDAKLTAIPGKMPKVACGKLAIQAAWEIEQETGRAAPCADVMAKLQQWATDGISPETLIKAVKEKRAVEWLTQDGTAKIYDTEACGKALKTWHKSRA